MGSQSPLNRLPVHVAIGPQTSHQPSAQLALLALANQLVRVHRRVTFSIGAPSARLEIANPFALSTLADTVLSLVKRIDPCGSFDVRTTPTPGDVISIAIGEEAQGQFDWYIGAQSAVAILGTSPMRFSTRESTLHGAALASCLGAAAVFRSMVGLESTARRVSAWNYQEGPEALAGPDSSESLDIGRILLVGSGAVAASMAYWINAFSLGGDWTVVDKDIVELHTTNRGMIFTPTDAGWPEGQALAKAQVTAGVLPGARYEQAWYDESRFAQEPYDVILGLANEFGVRHAIACRNNTVTLHATTGANWLSQMHRHIVGLDDCIWCRTEEAIAPRFHCSTAEVELLPGNKTDAALPFLSAASGLMLVTALERLQRGELANELRNDWRWDFGSTHRMVSTSMRKCRDGCRRVASPGLRRQMNAADRWRTLDGVNEPTV